MDNLSSILDRFKLVLKELIAFETLSNTSTEAVYTWIERYLASEGISCHRCATGYDTKIENLYTKVGNTGTGGVCLSGHIDVVPASEHGWEYPPFELTDKGSRLYGRGVVDMKGFLALSLALLPYLKSCELPFPIHLAITCDEEIGCKGVPELINWWDVHGVHPEIILVGEPTCCKPVNGHKSGVQCVTKFIGRSGHASDPDRGVNAIYRAMQYIEVLMEYQREDMCVHRAEEFSPPHMTVSVGAVHGGSSPNVIPDECNLMWEARTLPDTSALDCIDQIEKRYSESSDEGDQITPPNTEVLSSYPGLVPQSDSSAMRLLRALGCQGAASTVPFGTEAGHYAQAGYPVVVWGPGSIEQAHTPDEYIEMSQIESYLGYLLRLTELKDFFKTP